MCLTLISVLHQDLHTGLGTQSEAQEELNPGSIYSICQEEKNPSLIVNDLWVKSTLSQPTAETKVAIRVSGWANKTAQSAMTNWISPVSKRRPKWFEAQELNNSLGLKKKKWKKTSKRKKKKALFKKSIASKQHNLLSPHRDKTMNFSAMIWGGSF